MTTILAVDVDGIRYLACDSRLVENDNIILTGKGKIVQIAPDLYVGYAGSTSLLRGLLDAKNNLPVLVTEDQDCDMNRIIALADMVVESVYEACSMICITPYSIYSIDYTEARGKSLMAEVVPIKELCSAGSGNEAAMAAWLAITKCMRMPVKPYDVLKLINIVFESVHEVDTNTGGETHTVSLVSLME